MVVRLQVQLACKRVRACMQGCDGGVRACGRVGGRVMAACGRAGRWAGVWRRRARGHAAGRWWRRACVWWRGGGGHRNTDQRQLRTACTRETPRNRTPWQRRGEANVCSAQQRQQKTLWARPRRGRRWQQKLRDSVPPLVSWTNVWPGDPVHLASSASTPLPPLPDLASASTHSPKEKQSGKMNNP